MWIETDKGDKLVNINEVTTIQVAKVGQPTGDTWEVWAGGTTAAIYPTKAKAQAAMDKLKAWIDCGNDGGYRVGWIEQDGKHVYMPLRQQVFSFKRTLSEDDEF